MIFDTRENTLPTNVTPNEDATRACKTYTPPLLTLLSSTNIESGTNSNIQENSNGLLATNS